MNLNNLIQYCREMGIEDPLSGINVPAPLNASAVRSAIIVRCGLLTPVYGDPDVFRSIAADWFFSKQWTFKHLINIINAEYSPIENVDEYTDFSDSKESTGSSNETSGETKSGGWNETKGGGWSEAKGGGWTQSDTNTGGYTNTNAGGEVTENTISAENSNSYQPDNKSETTDTRSTANTHNDTNTTQHTTTETFNHSDTGTLGHIDTGRIDRTTRHTNDGDESLTHTGRRHGNIGVTTNQQLINSELDLLQHFDIYKYIANIFEDDLMLMIY